MTWQQSKSRHTLQIRLMQSLPILGQGWESLWKDYIMDSPRLHIILIDQLAGLMHFPMITWEYGAARMTKLPPWQRLIRSTGTGLTPSISDYLLAIGQAMAVDRRT
jgi:hypothetical protein